MLFVENSRTLQDILDDGSIVDWFELNAYKKMNRPRAQTSKGVGCCRKKRSGRRVTGTADIQNEVNLMVNNYCVSLAAYCVVTYLLGVGDRH